MPYKLNKIIYQRDWEWGYETFYYDLNAEIDFPYVAGMLQELVPKEKSQLSKYKPEISDTPLPITDTLKFKLLYTLTFL